MRLYLRVLLREPANIVVIGAVLGLVVLAAVAPSIWGEQASRLDPLAASQGSSWEHPFGTDSLGRDIFARTLTATRLSLELAVLSTGVAAGAGVLIGLLLAAVSSPAVRQFGARLLDAALAFPPIILALFFAAIFDVGGTGAALAVGIAAAPRFARFAHTLGSSIGGQDYIAAARLLGLPRRTLMFRHVLPNMAEPLLVTTFLAVGFAIMAVSALSFLGLGVQPLQYDWGSLLAEGIASIYTTPMAAIGPALAIAIAGTAFGFFGECLALAADPRRLASPRRRRRPRAPEKVARPVSAEATLQAPHTDNEETHNEDAVLAVEDLRVTIPTQGRTIVPVDGVSLTVRRGEVVGIVGESGSGKSLTLLAIAGLAPYPAVVTARRLEVAGAPVRGVPESLAIVFQDPTSALNPALRIRTQMTEALRTNGKLSRRAAYEHALDALRQVHLSSPELRMRQYAHQLSGGMRQRVAIAMGLATEPALLLADEPTTALDVTVQAQVISVLRSLASQGMGIILVSHDLGVAAEICDRIVVMYRGAVVEEGRCERVLESPLHPYTRALLSSIPNPAAGRTEPLSAIPTVQEEGDVMGCTFAPRCPLAIARCRSERPSLRPVRESQRVACLVVAAESELALESEPVS
ncbi:MAG: peptide ABC transporter ATP-binding protein [Gaiellaceae bacterium]|nr:MAG: peptide ABC transporter ATP-binding protein [Gaiellaceae bacterium]